MYDVQVYMCNSPQSPQSSEDYGDVKKVTVRVLTQSLSQGFYCVKGRSTLVGGILQ